MNLLLQGRYKTHASYRKAIEFEVKSPGRTAPYNCVIPHPAGMNYNLVPTELLSPGFHGLPIFIKFSSKCTEKRNSSGRYYPFDAFVVQHRNKTVCITKHMAMHRNRRQFTDSTKKFSRVAV